MVPMRRMNISARSSPVRTRMRSNNASINVYHFSGRVSFRLTASSSDQRRRVVLEMAGRWSALVEVALAVVILTGICSAWFELGRVEALWETAYGRLLRAKLSLVLI